MVTKQQCWWTAELKESPNLHHFSGASWQDRAELQPGTWGVHPGLEQGPTDWGSLRHPQTLQSTPFLHSGPHALSRCPHEDRFTRSHPIPDHLKSIKASLNTLRMHLLSFSVWRNALSYGWHCYLQLNSHGTSWIHNIYGIKRYTAAFWDALGRNIPVCDIRCHFHCDFQKIHV